MINRKKLEAELSEAMAKDGERKAVDDMKKRAILTAASYDEFKNLVACANLKPLSRDDFAKRASVSVNHALGGGAGTSASAARGELHSSKAHPRTAGEFDREWRRVGKAAANRVRLLYECCAAGMLPSIFRAELDAVLLGDAICAAVQVLDGPPAGVCVESKADSVVISGVRPSCSIVPGVEDWKVACLPLVQLTRTGGFSMAREFLIKSDLQRVSRLVDILRGLDSPIVSTESTVSDGTHAEKDVPPVSALSEASVNARELSDVLHSAYLGWKS